MSRDQDAEPLFRQVALEAMSSRWGSPVKPLGVASWALTSFLLVLLGTVAVFLVVGSFARKETVGGLLQPASGTSRIVALRPGIVEQVHVREGDYVEKGAPVVSVTSETRLVSAEGAGRSLGQGLEELTAEQRITVSDGQRAMRARFLEQRRSVESRIVALDAEQIRLSAERQLQVERIRLAEETFEAGQTLNERGLFSTLQLRQRHEAVLAARQALSSYDREISRISTETSQAGIEARRLEAEELQADAEVRRSRLELSERELTLSGERRVVLTAEKSGRVSALQARQGGAVTSGSTLALILPPEGGLVAELWVPSRAIGFVVAGSRVRLMYEAFPFQKFGVGHGTVTGISTAAIDTADLPASLGADEPLYKVTVAIDGQAIEAYGKQWPLTAGMRLSADVILERRTFLDWLLDPILAVTRRS